MFDEIMVGGLAQMRAPVRYIFLINQQVSSSWLLVVLAIKLIDNLPVHGH